MLLPLRYTFAQPFPITVNTLKNPFATQDGGQHTHVMSRMLAHVQKLATRWTGSARLTCMTIESRVLIMISKIFTGLCDTQIWLCQKLSLRPFTLLTPYMDEFYLKG